MLNSAASNPGSGQLQHMRAGSAQVSKALPLNGTPLPMNTINRQYLKSLMDREQKRFVDERPKSKALFERAGKSLLGGAHELDGEMGGRFPAVRARSPGGAFLRRGRPSLRRSVP